MCRDLPCREYNGGEDFHKSDQVEPNDQADRRREEPRPQPKE